jgi:hypothetical protein
MGQLFNFPFGSKVRISTPHLPVTNSRAFLEQPTTRAVIQLCKPAKFNTCAKRNIQHFTGDFSGGQTSCDAAAETVTSGCALNNLPTYFRGRAQRTRRVLRKL